MCEGLNYASIRPLFSAVFRGAKAPEYTSSGGDGIHFSNLFTEFSLQCCSSKTEKATRLYRSYNEKMAYRS
jgi:hypothetical protein